MTEETRYQGASIKARVTVEAYRVHGEAGYSFTTKRTVDFSFDETFSDDAELDDSLEAFTRAVKEAARR